MNNEAPRLIAVSAFAQSGKDTFYEFLKHHAHDAWGMKVHKWKFADALRQSVREECLELGIDPWTEHPDEKEIIRPILVRVGQEARAKNPDHWVETLLANKLPLNGIVVITDMRYVNELLKVEAQKDPEDKFYVWLDREGKGPANDEEKEYTTLLREELFKYDNAVHYAWLKDFDNLAYENWDSGSKAEIYKDLTEQVFNPIQEYWGLKIVKP